MNKATEVMLQYVENLKRTYEKDHAELMEFKKVANQNRYSCSMESGGACWPDILPQSETLSNYIFNLHFIPRYF